MSYQNSPTGEEEISPLVADTGNEIRKKYSYWHSGDWKANPRAIFTEFVGTMLFVFSLTMSGVVANKTPGLGFGSAVLGTAGSLLALVHALAPISGAHFNPAVTVAALVTRHIGLVNGLLYIIAQLIGAIAGTALTFVIEGNDGSKLGSLSLSKDEPLRGLLLEIIMTFILVTVVFGVGIKAQHFPEDPRLEPLTAAFAALPVASAVAAMIAAGALTGTGMNPARSFGPELLSNNWNKNSWVYYVGPILGGILAAANYEFVLTKKRESYWRPKGDTTSLDEQVKLQDHNAREHIN